MIKPHENDTRDASKLVRQLNRQGGPTITRQQAHDGARIVLRRCTWPGSTEPSGGAVVTREGDGSPWGARYITRSRRLAKGWTLEHVARALASMREEAGRHSERMAIVGRLVTRIDGHSNPPAGWIDRADDYAKANGLTLIYQDMSEGDTRAWHTFLDSEGFPAID